MQTNRHFHTDQLMHFSNTECNRSPMSTHLDQLIGCSLENKVMENRLENKPPRDVIVLVVEESCG